MYRAQTHAHTLHRAALGVPTAGQGLSPTAQPGSPHCRRLKKRRSVPWSHSSAARPRSVAWSTSSPAAGAAAAADVAAAAAAAAPAPWCRRLPCAGTRRQTAVAPSWQLLTSQAHRAPQFDPPPPSPPHASRAMLPPPPQDKATHLGCAVLLVLHHVDVHRAVGNEAHHPRGAALAQAVDAGGRLRQRTAHSTPMGQQRGSGCGCGTCSSCSLPFWEAWRRPLLLHRAFKGAFKRGVQWGVVGQAGRGVAWRGVGAAAPVPPCPGAVAGPG